MTENALLTMTDARDLRDATAIEILKEHAAVNAAVQSGIEHAKRAGELLIGVKKGLPHGEWLPWLHAHCPTISPWTAQAYMRLARRWPELESANAGRVTHLSTRAALASLTQFSMRLAGLPAADQQAVLDRVDAGNGPITSAVSRVRRERMHQRFAEGCAAVDRPVLPTDRVLRVIRAKDATGEECWTVSLGSNQAALDIRPRIAALKATPKYRKREAAIKAMHDRVARLRSQAKALEQRAWQHAAQTVADQSAELKRKHGPAYIYRETATFWQVPADLAARLPTMSVDEQVDALYAQGDPRAYGWSGDILLGGYSANGPGPGPGNTLRASGASVCNGWTRVGNEIDAVDVFDEVLREKSEGNEGSTQ